MAGLFWAIDTVVLSFGLSTISSIWIPLVFTFIHDFFSSMILLIYRNKKSIQTWHCLKTKKGRILLLSSILGGPIGMSAYVLSISFIGSSYSAMISSIFPAFGIFFASIFLKERMTTIQKIGLVMCLLGACGLGYSQNLDVTNFKLGFLCALLCCICWALEGVISAIAMKESDIDNEMALQIRQSVSFLFYAIVIMNVFHLWKYLHFNFSIVCIIFIASIFGTLSYLFYYGAIRKIGVSKAMPLDITYGAWALVINSVLSFSFPSIKDGLCALIMLIGAIVAGV